jgi:hypothetical protein
MNESYKDYQQREMRAFLNQKNRYFDTVSEFAEALDDMDILEQIEWIENGSYGAGACFALQNTLKNITPRCNGNARIGLTVLHAFYGCPFRYWNKLPANVQDKMNDAVTKWREQEHSFAQELE